MSKYDPDSEHAYRDGYEKGRKEAIQIHNGMTVTEMVQRCYNNAVTLGWAEKTVPVPEMCALIHSEVSEALEEFRNNKPISYTSESGKPEGIASEFADVVIRIGHYSKLLGIVLEKEIDRKLTYNLSRGHRHGGKAI